MSDAESEAKTGKNILLLGLVSFLNDISSEIIQPVLPLLLSSLGGGSLAVGLVGGFSEGLPSLIKLFSGCWSDRIGRRLPLVVGGYALSALGKVLLAAASSWPAVFVLKSLERCGKGLRSPPRDAMISESAPKNSRGRGFGLHRAMDSAGAVIGSLLAYSLWQMGLSYSSIFLVAGALALLALLLFVYWPALEGYRGQSLGKMLLNIVVTGPVGECIRFRDAAVEAFGKAFLLPLDCLLGWLYFRKKRQRLFSRLADSVVVNRMEYGIGRPAQSPEKGQKIEGR